MARKLTRGRSAKRGLPPGTPVYIGERKAQAVRVTLIDYDEAKAVEKQVDRVEECFPFKDKPTVTWINVDGLSDTKLIQSLSENFAVHPLVQEDILNTDQRPKVEDFEDFLYIVLKMLRWNDEANEIDIEQVSLILGPNFVISFQERPGDVFEAIRDRIRTSKGRIRKVGADYLAYSLIDAIVDGYFTILEKMGERIEALEEHVVTNPRPATLKDIHKQKRDALFLRKSVWPLREVVSGLQRAESPLVKKETGIYLRDVYDHTIQVIDTMETFRDMLAGMLDTYLSSLSNRMNEVMKVLTIIATIFIPLTFIAGVYGMNFEFMPELHKRWAYPAVLAVMLAVAVLMILYFRRKRWL